MVKILGLLDLVAAFLLYSLAFRQEFSLTVLLVISGFLFIKACLSIYDIGGMTDMAIVILIVLTIFTTLPFWFLVIGSFVIGFKGIMSLFA